MCTTHHGLRVISGSKASDEALEQTAHLINLIMDYVDPRVAPKMTSNGFRHTVMAPYPTELTTDPAAENKEPATFLTGLRIPDTAPPNPLPPPIIDLRRNAIMNVEARHLLFLFFTVIQKTYCCLHTCKCRQTFYPTSCRLSESSVKV